MMKKIFALLISALLVCSVTLSARIPVRIACIGDSITFGHGVADWEHNHYPAVLQSLMGSAYEVRNYGISARVMVSTGDNPYMNEAAYGELKSWLPDIVVIMLGTNDTKPHNWNAGQYRDDYRKMIHELKALDSHPDIYLCYPPTVVTDRWGINEKCVSEEVIPIIDSLASDEWLDAIDTHSATAGMPENYLDDGVHPNAGGAAAIARCVADALHRNGYSANPGLRVVFVGDSISDGEWGGGRGLSSQQRRHDDGNHVLGHGFPEMCAARCMADNPGANLHFYNRGISGNSLVHLDGRWETDVLSVHPDVISILVGVNDTAPRMADQFDYGTWEARFRSILDRTIAADPDVMIVLCSPFITKKRLDGSDPGFDERHAKVERLGAIMKELAADYGCVYVDTYNLVENLVADDKSSDHKYWMWDGVHPTTACHQKIADLWVKSTRRLFR